VKLERILFVTPSVPENDGFLSSLTNQETKTRLAKLGAGVVAPIAPLPMATVAALTPAEIDVEIWDEMTRGPVDDKLREGGYDLVGLTGFTLHRARVLKIADACRSRGIRSVLGGPGVSSEPELYRKKLDHIFIGEAELTWPQFIEDFRAGRSKPEYRQIDKPDLSSTPAPRWDLIPDLAAYGMAPVQTTRGCPFDCEFCDVIHLFGRRSRHKPIELVLDEVRELERRGARRIMFSDDNFIGHPPYAKELLGVLIQLNNSFNRPLSFFTQLTINVARDDELLGLLADANFRKLLIGIESANPESLREANKPQNYRTDLLADIRKIHSYGLAIHGQMIIGFDNDGPEVFEQTYQFIQQSCIPTIVVTRLNAPPGTMLWHRLRREHRILAMDDGDSESFTLSSNILYKNMSRAEVIRGVEDLKRRIYAPKAVRERLDGMLQQVQRRPRVRQRLRRALREDRQRMRGGLKMLLFDEDKEMRRVFRRALLDTVRRAPFMMEEMARTMVAVSLIRNHIEAVAPQLEKVIQNEKERPRQRLMDQAVTIPVSFRKDFRKVFPSVYLRLAARLQDKSNLQTGLVTVFCEFLERFHQEYERLGEQRFTQLEEICDRTIARFNDEDPTTGSWPDAPAVRPLERLTNATERRVVHKVRRARLDDDIFHAVELELKDSEERRTVARLGDLPVIAVPVG
jgi:radical SAM superfamily enzyme YgiQ (UPF0313 family)